MNQTTGSSSLISKILTSIFYRNTLKRATRMSGSKASLLALVAQVLFKSNEKGTAGFNKGVGGRFSSLVKLVRAYASGEYREVSTKSLITVVGGLIYFISPLDVIPDVIPILGFADDIALITYLISTLNSELEKFELWVANKNLNS